MELAATTAAAVVLLSCAAEVSLEDGAAVVSLVGAAAVVEATEFVVAWLVA